MISLVSWIASTSRPDTRSAVRLDAPSHKPATVTEELRKNRPKPISPRHRPSVKARMQGPGEATSA